MLIVGVLLVELSLLLLSVVVAGAKAGKGAVNVVISRDESSGNNSSNNDGKRELCWVGLKGRRHLCHVNKPGAGH